MRWYWYVIIGLVALVAGGFAYFYYMGNSSEADKMERVRSFRGKKEEVKEEAKPVEDEASPKPIE